METENNGNMNEGRRTNGNAREWCDADGSPVFVRFGPRPRPVRTGPRTTVFSGPCSDEMEGPGPVLVRSGPSVLCGP